MMQYAGIELPMVSAGLAKWIESIIPPAKLTQFETYYNADPLGCLPVPPAYEPPPVVPGVLTWPTGASRWATFYTVLTGEQLAALRLVLIPDPETDLGGYPSAELEITDDRGTVTAQMTMLPPRPLSGWSPEPTVFAAPWVDGGDCGGLCGEGTGEPCEDIETKCTECGTGTGEPCEDPESEECEDCEYEYQECIEECDECLRECEGNPAGNDEIFGETPDLYLVTLVDDRYFWWFQRQSSLVRTAWRLLFEDLLETVGYTVDPASYTYLDDDYPAPGTRWDVKNLPVPLLLDAAAAAIGRRFIRRMDDGEWDLQAWNDARVASQVLFANQYDADWPEGESGTDLTDSQGFGRVAGGTFPSNELRRNVPASITVVQGDDGDTSSSTITLDSLAIPAYQEILGRTGETAIVRVDDGSTLEFGMADRAARDWYGWALADVDLTLAGVVEWTPCAWQDSVTWDHSTPQVTTRIVRPPFPSGAAKDLCGGTGGDDSFLVCLVGKSGSTCPVYTFRRIEKTEAGCGWAVIDEEEEPEGSLYELNAVDLPVNDPVTESPDQFVVARARPGSGPFFIFRMNPRWEFVKTTDTEPDPTSGYYPGFIMNFDTGGEPVDAEEIWILDLNATP